MLRWAELHLPSEHYPKYVLIYLLDIMQHRDDFIYGLCILEELTRAGVKILPPLKAIYNSDKFSNYLLWNRYLCHDINMPDTLCTINLENSMKFLNKYKRLIFKPISGSQGIGIEIIERENRLKELMDLYHVLFLQNIIPDRGYDIRTLVIDGQVISQYARYNPNTTIKNLHCGAVPKSLNDLKEFDPKIMDFAVKSQEISRKIGKIAGLDIFGVDTLPSKDGKIYLIEWNSIPGFRGAEEIKNLNIAKKIIDSFLK
ncbi:MAG: ATP-grasp domain-containing protein [Candidatus Helarchaeota archaeon]